MSGKGQTDWSYEVFPPLISVRKSSKLIIVFFWFIIYIIFQNKNLSNSTTVLGLLQMETTTKCGEMQINNAIKYSARKYQSKKYDLNGKHWCRERLDLFITFQSALHCYVLRGNRLPIWLITDQFQELTGYSWGGPLIANGRFLTGLILQEFLLTFLLVSHYRYVLLVSAMVISTALPLGECKYIISSIWSNADIPVRCYFVLGSWSFLATELTLDKCWIFLLNIITFFRLLWNLLLTGDFNKDKSIQSRWILTEKKLLSVEALNNIREDKWNCNVMYSLIMVHHTLLYIHTYINLFKIILAEIFLSTL